MPKGSVRTLWLNLCVQMVKNLMGTLGTLIEICFQTRSNSPKRQNQETESIGKADRMGREQQSEKVSEFL